jgi:hypothetical protein
MQHQDQSTRHSPVCIVKIEVCQVAANTGKFHVALPPDAGRPRFTQELIHRIESGCAWALKHAPKPFRIGMRSPHSAMRQAKHTAVRRNPNLLTDRAVCPLKIDDISFAMDGFSATFNTLIAMEIPRENVRAKTQTHTNAK